MTTEDDFHAMLDANPGDWMTRLVFADWLGERGDPRAEGYRALGARCIYPLVVPANSDEKKRRGWAWFMDASSPQAAWIYSHETEAEVWAAMFYRGQDYRRALVHGDWFARVRHPGKSDSLLPLFTTTHHPRAGLENALALAFSKLPPERRAELLA